MKLESVLFYHYEKPEGKDCKEARKVLETAKIPYHAVPQPRGYSFCPAIETSCRIYSGLDEIKRYVERGINGLEQGV